MEVLTQLRNCLNITNKASKLFYQEKKKKKKKKRKKERKGKKTSIVELCALILNDTESCQKTRHFNVFCYKETNEGTECFSQDAYFVDFPLR